MRVEVLRRSVVLKIPFRRVCGGGGTKGGIRCLFSRIPLRHFVCFVSQVFTLRALILSLELVYRILAKVFVCWFQNCQRSGTMEQHFSPVSPPPPSYLLGPNQFSIMKE